MSHLSLLGKIKYDLDGERIYIYTYIYIYIEFLKLSATPWDLQVGEGVHRTYH